MPIFCNYCHLPLLIEGTKDPYCSYGCALASNPKHSVAKPGLFLAGLLLAFVGVITAIFYGRVDLSFDLIWIQLAATTLSGLILVPPLFNKTLQSVLHQNLAPEFLNLLAIGVTYGISVYAYFYDAPFNFFGITSLALLIFPLVYYWEARLRRGSLSDLHQVLNLRVAEARQIRGKNKTMVSTKDLKIGDMIQVNPGEPIACDGMIVSGTTRVDESRLTRQPTPLFKTKGDFVLAGSINQDGVITIKITTPLSDHFLERVISHMDRARGNALDLQKKIRRLLVIMIPATFLWAVVAFLYWKDSGITIAITTSIAVLMAPIFSSLFRVVPMGVNFGMGRALDMGILLSSGESLFRLSRLNTLVFDKTGVASLGDFQFSQFFSENGVNQGTLLSAFFSLAAYSEHPLCRAMQSHPWYVEIAKHPVKEFKTHPGLGIGGIISVRGEPETFVAVGNVRFLRRFQMQMSPAMREKVENLEAMGDTVILCGWNREVYGLMSFSDTLRPDMKPLLTQLQKLKVTPIVMTGDHDEMIGHLSHTQGIEKVYTRCLPDEKIKRIKKLKEEGARVGYVGARYDDMAILGEADSAIIFNAGTTHLVESAESLIFGEQLASIANLLRIARKSQRVVALNLTLGLVASFSGMTLAAISIWSPVASLLTMATVSLVLNLTPMRVRRAKLE